VQRRSFCLGLSALSAACDHFAPSDATALDLTDEEKAIKRRFRGVAGGELIVDGIKEFIGVNIFDHRGDYFFVRASVSIFNKSKYEHSFTNGPPKTIRVQWRDGYVPGAGPEQKPGGLFEKKVDGAFYGGTILGDYTVPVADRIPDALIADWRKGKMGGFRLKIRLHEDGPLVGWDLSDFVEAWHVGGDFQEARLIFEGDRVKRATKRWTKGWYIHPKTKERIETDF
jgi:hypothetical protein